MLLTTDPEQAVPALFAAWQTGSITLERFAQELAELVAQGQPRSRGAPRRLRVYRTEAGYREAIWQRIILPAARSGWNLSELPETFFAEQLAIAYGTYLKYNAAYGITAEMIRGETI